MKSDNAEDIFNEWKAAQPKTWSCSNGRIDLSFTVDQLASVPDTGRQNR